MNSISGFNLLLVNVSSTSSSHFVGSIEKRFSFASSNSPAMAQAIVVGGGLAGVSAANTVLECGGKVVLVDKSAFCGGNSTKATSGINGAETQTQKTKKVEETCNLSGFLCFL